MSMLTFQRMRQRRAAAAAGKTIALVEGNEIQGIRESGTDLNEIHDDVNLEKQKRGESTGTDGIPTRPGYPRGRREAVTVDPTVDRKPGAVHSENNPDNNPASPKAPQERQQVKVAKGNVGATENVKIETKRKVKPLVEGREPNANVESGSEENPDIPPQEPLSSQNPSTPEETGEETPEGEESSEGAEREETLEGGEAGDEFGPSEEGEEPKDEVYSRKWLLRELKELEEPELMDLANARDIAIPPGISKNDIADIIFQNQKENSPHGDK